MKVLILTSQVFQLGGAEQLSLELVDGLNQNDVEADLGILYLSHENYPNNEKIVNGIPLKLGNWFNLELKLNAKPVCLLFVCIRLIYLIKKRGYTHIETSLLNTSILGTLVSIFTRVKHVVGFHQSYQSQFSSDYRYKLFFALCKFSRNNLYYGISDFVVTSWVKSKKIKFKEIRTIYNSVNILGLSKEISKESLYKSDRFIVLSIGRLTKLKGYHILFDSIKYDLKKYNISIYYLGALDHQSENDKDEFKRVNAEILNLGLDDHVFFLGFKTNAVDYLAHCDLFVHHTKLEGFGLVLIEAMLMRKPIITTDVEAIPEILDNTEIIKLPFGDKTSLRNSIITHINNSAFNKFKIEMAYKRANYFSKEKRIQSFISLMK